MFIIVEGGNHWDAEVKFVEEFKMEVGDKRPLEVTGIEAFLSFVRNKERETEDFVFVKGILPLVDCRSLMFRENREVCYWFVEHRKVENEHIVLSDVFILNNIDVRIRRLLTHRVRVAGSVEDIRYRILGLSTTRAEGGKLGERPVLEALAKSNEPLTLEEIEKLEKEFEQALED